MEKNIELKLIKIDESNYVVVEENTIVFTTGDFVLVNCSEVNVKNEIKQIISHKDPDLLFKGMLVFEYNVLTRESDAIHRMYCRKIIYSTRPLNGVKFIDINYIKNLINDKDYVIELRKKDLINIITDYQRTDVIDIEDFLNDHPITKIKNDIWDVEIKNNYIVLKKEKSSDNGKVMLEIDDYYKIMKLLQNINTRNHDVCGIDHKIDDWSGQITTILQNSFINKSLK